MDKNKEMLNVMEQESVLNAVMELIRTYPLRGSIEVGFEALNKDGKSMGVYGISGAVVEKRFINGSFIGNVPFGIILRSNARTDEQKIACIEYLSKLAKWLNLEEIEEKGIKYHLESYPPLTEQRKIISIEQESTPFKDNSDGAGDHDYAVRLKIRYKKS